MIKLILKFLLLLIVAATLGAAIVSITPYGRDEGFNNRAILESDDKNKLGWIHERIGRPIDYAFVGSSHTMRGIDDSQIEDEVRAATGDKRIVVANLGRNWFGRNIDYLIVKELLERQKPKVVFLEVPDRVPLGGHVFFPILATREDLPGTISFNNLRIFTDMRTVFRSRLDAILRNVSTDNRSTQHDSYLAQHGYLPTVGEFHAKDAVAAFSSQQGITEKLSPGFYHRLQEYNATFDWSYTEKILNLAKEKHVRVEFLFIPIFGRHEVPAEYREKNLKILVPPAEIFTNDKNFSDIAHLNPIGSRLLSAWIANVIVDDVRTDLQ